MLGLILSAGDGVRFSGGGCCKALLKINGSYLIEYSLENLAALGVGEAVIVVGKYAKEIREAIGDSFKNIKLRYVIQEQPLGLMNAVYTALDALTDESVILQLSDEIFIEPNFGEIALASGSDFLCGYTVPKNPEIIKENYALSCSDGYIEFTVEKPKTIMNGKKGTGLCVFNSGCFHILKNIYSDDLLSGNLCDFINLLIENGKKGVAVQIAEEEININDPEMYAYAKQRLERADYE